MLSATPVLPASDLARSVAFWRDLLGFDVLHHADGYAVLRRGAAGVHLWEASDESWRGRAGDRPVVSGAESFLAGTASCRVQVSGVDALFAALQPRGIVHPDAPLRDQWWGSREFGVRDPDGNLVTFYEAREAGPRPE
ncbi:MAG: VOC family protein [Planctomycetes bacterium]|nr:VOC family protein [Planctomycetota bacterium]